MAEGGHILIVDDEPELRAQMAMYLSEHGYSTSVAADGAMMRQVLAQSSVDLILLDLGLPNEDGLELARELRARGPGLRVIIITGRGDTIDRIVGLEMGADDYLVKPFHLRELLARVRSVLRRAAAPAEELSASDRRQLRFAGWRLDPAARELFSPSGENVRLTAGEFDLLMALVTHPNQVMSRDRLLGLVHDRTSSVPFDRTIDVQIARLRRKLESDARRPQLIKTVRSGGYMFSAPLEPGPRC